MALLAYQFASNREYAYTTMQLKRSSLCTTCEAGRTKAEKGDYIYATYTGVFAPETSYGGKDYGGQQFDSTWDSKRACGMIQNRAT